MLRGTTRLQVKDLRLNADKGGNPRLIAEARGAENGMHRRLAPSAASLKEQDPYFFPS